MTPRCACGCGGRVTIYYGKPRKWIRGHYDKGHLRRPERECPVCGVRYRPKRASTKTCSSRCGGVVAMEGRPRAIGRYREVGGRYEHRVVAERVLGRALSSEEVVHHIDRDRSNNDPRNLMVFPTQADHSRFHRRGGVVVSLADQT